MIALTTWGFANLTAGTTLWLVSPTDSSWRYFHQMNALWNTVNVTLGIIGWVNSNREVPSATPINMSIQRSRKSQQVFAINLGIDFAYLTAGALTWDLGETYQNPRAIGWGQSIVLQGGFLLVFDAVMLGLHQRHLERFLSARKRVSGVRVGPWKNGLGLQVSAAF